MTASAPRAAVSGASGYLGSRICTALESRGWEVVSLVRNPRTFQGRACRYDLADPISAEVNAVLPSCEVLVHAAYDMSLTREPDIWRVNVDGTRRLLVAATEARVRRIIVLSSMSAFEGTRQLYGRAKLDIEAMTVSAGGCPVRPGLVLGRQSGGMGAALRTLTRLPVVPVIHGGAQQYTVLEEDLMAAIAAMASIDALPPVPISVAHETPLGFAHLLTALAEHDGRRVRLVRVPWRSIYWGLRVAEELHVPVPFRADSLLGLVRTAPRLEGEGVLAQLGVAPRAFDGVPTRRGKGLP